MTNTQKAKRPLSPHLQVYRPQMTSMLSILHRMTGIANMLGLIVLTAWLFCISAGPQMYQSFAGFMGSVAGQFLLIGWSFSVFYHLFNGIRHLIWDTGRLFKIENATKAGYIVFYGAILVTTATWACIYVYG